MQREAGAVGRMLAHGVIDGLLPPVWERGPHEFPLTGEVLASRRGVIVHSRYVERRVSRARLRRAGLADPAPGLAGADGDSGRRSAERSLHRRLLRPPQPGQALPQLLEAFALLRERVPEALLLLVGSLSPGLELDAHREGVRATTTTWTRSGSGRCSPPATSASASATRRWARPRACVVRALSLGRPLVVSDVGWFAELPDEVAVKIPVGGEEVASAR